MELVISIKIDGEEVKVEKELVIPDTKKTDSDGNHEFTPYARWFDNGCFGWTEDPEYNKLFLLQQQNYMNEMLRKKGHLFLNEVYDCLGIPRTAAGQMVGWIYDTEHPYCNNFVDFGLMENYNRDFINGKCKNALLEFNIDGNIVNMI